MNRTDYIIKRNLSKLSTSKLYNLLQMNECYDNKIVCLAFLFNEDMYYKFVESHLGAKKIIIIDNYIEQFEWIVKRFSFAKDKIQFVEYSDKIKFNKMPHFDVTIMNPPYGSTGGNILHINITNDIKQHSNLTISLFPITFVTKVNNEKLVDIKKDFSTNLVSVKEISAKVFENTWMPNVGIYMIDNNKQSKNIHIELQDKTFDVQSLNDIKTFNDYEEEFLQKISENGMQEFIGDFGRLNCWKISGEDKKITLKRIVPKICEKYKQRLCGKVYVMTNTYIPVGQGIAFTQKLGKIFTNYDDVIEFFIENPYSRGTNLFIFNSVNEAQNFITAIKNPVLRFTIYKLQDDQNLTKRIFKYIPAIDWKDSRVVTDEGLLEVCGCPTNKCKEYAEYCKNYMEKVDNGTLNS